MKIFPSRWMGRKIPVDKLPKHYLKNGRVYETRTNKEVK